MSCTRSRIRASASIRASEMSVGSNILIEAAPHEHQAAKPRAPRGGGQGFYRQIWIGFRRDHIAVTSAMIFALIVAFVLGAPLISHFTGFGQSENHLPMKLSGP